MPLPTDHISRVSLAQEAYSRLETAIMEGVLEPGERLRDPDLAEWLGISRTPIRHALERLAEQGLVEMEQNRYTRVAPLDFAGVLAAAEVACDLWAGAALRGLDLWTVEDDLFAKETVESLLEAASREDAVDMGASLEELMVMFARIEGNQVRLNALEAVLPRVRRLIRKLKKTGSVHFIDQFAEQLLASTAARQGRKTALLIEAIVADLTKLLRNAEAQREATK